MSTGDLHAFLHICVQRLSPIGLPPEQYLAKTEQSFILDLAQTLRSPLYACSEYTLIVLSAPPVINLVPVLSKVEQNTPCSSRISRCNHGKQNE